MEWQLQQGQRASFLPQEQQLQHDEWQIQCSGVSRGFLSVFTLFQWQELSEPLARFRFAHTAKKIWYSLQRHISVLVTARTGIHCHLCVTSWDTRFPLTIISGCSNSNQPRPCPELLPELPQVKNPTGSNCVFKNGINVEESITPPFKLPSVYSVLHQSGEGTMHFTPNAEGSSVAGSHDLSGYPFFKGCLSFPQCH